jgi:PAS domain S-box-containing protein
VRSINRLTLRFSLLVALAAVALLYFRWHTAAAQVHTLESQLAESGEALARLTARRVAEGGVIAGPTLIGQLRSDEPRLLAASLHGPDGRVDSSGGPALSSLQALTLDPSAPMRGQERGGLMPVPHYYVLDRPLSGSQVLRLVYDAQPLVAAWRSMVLPALGVLAAMALSIIVLFRWLMVRPLASLREITEFATALPGAPGARLAVDGSHLQEVDVAREALNQAAKDLEAHRHALDQQRALLRGVIDALPGGVALKTLEGQLLLVNAYLARRLDLTPAEIEGRAMGEFGTPQLRERMTALDVQLLAGQRGGVVSDTFLAADQLVHLVNKTLLDLPGREEPLILTTTTNVSELHRSRRAVEEGWRLLRSVIDADEAEISLKDREGRFVLVNQATQRYWGMTEEQMLGRRSIDLFENTEALFRNLDTDRQVWEGAGPLVGEYRVDGPDGRKSDMVFMRRLVTSLDGHELLLIVGRDVTRLRELARLNRHHESLVREVIDLEDHFIVVKDAQLRYVLVNAAYARAVGRSEDAFVGRTVAEVFDLPECGGRVLEADLRVIREGVTTVQEETANIGQGPRRYLASKRPIELADGSRGVLAVIRDVTEERDREASLRQAMEQAQAAVETRARFLANISHEIRTPINGIMGMTDLVLDSALSPQQRERLQHARISADALLAIVNDLLDLSKIDAGAVSVERTEFDLHALLVAVSHVVAPRAGSKGLRFTLAIDPDVPERILGDAVRLRQVLTNLLGNAVKFTERGGFGLHARLATSTASPTLRLEVEDSGLGIDEAEQQRIFEPFTQVDESSTRRHGGTGLGLSISRELATLMGGTITLSSGRGKGSCFVLELPLADLARPPSPAPMSGRQIAWLCAEGSAPPWLAWLRQWGAQVWLAQTPQQVAATASAPIDTVVIDGLAPCATFEPAVQEWRAQAHLQRVLVLDSPTHGALEADALRVHLPSLRGLPLARAMQPLTPRELHTLLNPRSERRPAAAPTVPAPEGDRARLQGLRVLLAEDNEVNCLVAEAVLVKHGARVAIARDGAAALEQLRDAPFDVALVDVQMPRLDGIEVVTRWREEEGQRSRGDPLTMLAMTAHAMAGDRERFLRAGFDGYVGKPYTPHELLREIERALAGRAAATGT